MKMSPQASPPQVCGLTSSHIGRRTVQNYETFYAAFQSSRSL